MPRRFALLLLALLLLLLAAFLLGRRFAGGLGRPRPSALALPTPRPTPQVPPTPIPARRVALLFEAEADGLLHPEARDLPAAGDPAGFLRSLAEAVMEGPRRPGLLPPFPDGWRLRAAYRLKDGLAVLDLEPTPPEPGQEGEAPVALSSSAKWQTGSHEEWMAVQSLVHSVARNLPEASRFVLLVSGEPVDTLFGHVDLTHPLHADPLLAVDEPAGDPPPLPTPALKPTAAPSPTPNAPAQKGARKPAPSRTPAPATPVPAPGSKGSPPPRGTVSA